MFKHNHPKTERKVKNTAFDRGIFRAIQNPFGYFSKRRIRSFHHRQGIARKTSIVILTPVLLTVVGVVGYRTIFVQAASPATSVLAITQEDYIFENDDGGLTGASEGPLITATGADDSSIGTATWTSPTNVTADDGSEASVIVGFGAVSHYIKGTNFSFSIPATATITGIEARFDRRASAEDVLETESVKIVKGGTITGSDLTDDINWGTLSFPLSYGGEGELWGTTWTPTDINASNFGTVVSVTGLDLLPATAYVDYIDIEVFYDDIVDGTVQAGSQFSSPKTLANARKGERTNLRMHLKNTGDTALTATDELALFYDRNNDGFWTKVQSDTPVESGPGTGEDCAGFDGGGGSTNWYCETLIDGSGNFDFFLSAIAVHPLTGQPWVATKNNGDNDLVVARYVGSGGDCDTAIDSGGSDAWSCEVVVDGGSGDFDSLDLAFTDTGVPWISFNNSDGTTDEVSVATYVGSGGDCDDFEHSPSDGSNAWACTKIHDGGENYEGLVNSIAIDADGDPWVAFRDVEAAGDDVVVAEFVGSGGDCDTLLDGGGGSDAWECEVVFDGGESIDNNLGDGREISIGFASDGTAWLAFLDEEVNDSNIIVASRVGSGGDCSGFDDTGGVGGSNAWDCTLVYDGDEGGTGSEFEGRSLRMAFAPDGHPWISFFGYEVDGHSELVVANYVVSGGNCNSFDVAASGGSNAWQCTNVWSGNEVWDGEWSSIAFDPSGTATVAFAQQDAAGLDDLYMAKYVGSGGNCDSIDDLAGGTTAWECELVHDDAQAIAVAQLSLAYGLDGNAWISFTDDDASSADDLAIARTKFNGEITIAPSHSFVNGETLAESHADMTSATDTGNRDSADCVSASTTWNDGKYFSSENGTGLTIPIGDVTAQCSEVMWTLDTSQATPGTTYRFVIATDDAVNIGKNKWRGPSTIDEYPTLTIKGTDNDSIRYSKGFIYAQDGGCSGSSDWRCTVVDATNNTGRFTSMAFDLSGNPWISYYDPDDLNLNIAQYVGSGGNCDDSGGSDAWNCEIIDGTGSLGQHTSIAFDPSGSPWISYRASTGNDLKVANYVGSGGNCDDSGGSDAWQCTIVDATSDSGEYSSLAIGPSGDIWVSYYDNGSNDNLKVAQYVGSGGNCTSAAWECTVVDATGAVGLYTSIAVGLDGVPWVSYRDLTGTELQVAQYVGSGGNCDATGGSDAWQCTVVDTINDSSLYTSIAIDSSGNPWISYRDSTANNLKVANYVGTSGNCSSTAWDCVTVDSSETSGRYTSIAFDPSGNAWVSYVNETGDDLKVATYVGGVSGSCSSTAWDCVVVDSTGDVGWDTSIAFDPSGNPWVSYYDSTADDLNVATLNRPSTPLSNATINTPSSRNAGSGDYQYRLSSGRSNYDATGFNCSSNNDHAGYCGLLSDNGDYDSLIASNPDEAPLYGLATRFDSNATVPSMQWIGNTNLAPSTASTPGDIVMEVYRFGTTNAWEEVSRDSASSDCSTDNCVLNGIPSGTVGEYFETIDSKYWIYIRVYQVTDSFTTINFKVDAFRAQQQSSSLRHGGFFRDGELLPLNQRR